MTGSRNTGSSFTARDSDNAKAQATPSSDLQGMTYNRYLHVSELTQLQICQSDPAHHDETLFITVHQVYELWFKVILHEFDAVFELLKDGHVRKATAYMRRVNAILRHSVDQIHLLETMTPQDYLGFRFSFGGASGFGSSQFREIEFAAGLRYPEILGHFAGQPEFAQLKKRMESPSLGEAFYEVLRKNGFVLPEAAPTASEAQIEEAQNKRAHELLKLYMNEEKFGTLLDFAETLVEFDEFLFLWRSHHVIFVERMIGFKRGSGGSEGVRYLQSTLSKRCFPDLWKVRALMERPSDLNQPQSPPAQGGGCPFHS